MASGGSRELVSRLLHDERCGFRGRPRTARSTVDPTRHGKIFPDSGNLFPAEADNDRLVAPRIDLIGRGMKRRWQGLVPEGLGNGRYDRRGVKVMGK